MKPGPKICIIGEQTIFTRLKTVWDIGTILTAFSFALVAYAVEIVLKWGDE